MKIVNHEKNLPFTYHGYYAIGMYNEGPTSFAI